MKTIHVRRQRDAWFIAGMAVIMVSALLLVSSGCSDAESGTLGDDIVWEYEGGSLVISGSGPMPDFTGGSTTPWSSLDVTSLTIGEGITTIGMHAFDNEANIGGIRSFPSLTIPSTVESIGPYAFKACSALKQVTFLGDLDLIGMQAFDSTGLETLAIGSVREIGASAFGASSIGKVSIGYVESLGYAAFKECVQLKVVQLPEGLSTIGGSAFFRVPLESVVIPSTVTSIGARAFTVLFVDSVGAQIGQADLPGHAYCGSDGALERVDVGMAFEHEGLMYKVSSIQPLEAELVGRTIGGGLLAVPSEASLSGLMLPVVSIGERAFIRNAEIYMLDAPDVRSIGAYAFYSSGMSLFDAPSLESIGDYAFCGCPIGCIEFYDSLKTIGKAAFKGCAEIWKVRFPASLESIGTNAFYSATFYGPDGETVLEKSAASLAGKTFMDAGDRRLVCEVYDGYRFVADGVEYEVLDSQDMTAVAVGFVPGITEISVPATVQYDRASLIVERIADRAFYGCSTAVSATISVPLGVRAFTNCTSLEEVSFGRGVCDIPDYAFYGCSKISELDLWGVESIGNRAFYGCTGLTAVGIGYLQSLGPYAFHMLTFKDGERTLAQNVENLGGRMFVGSDAVLRLYLEPFVVLGIEYTPVDSGSVVVSGYEGQVGDVLIEQSVCKDNAWYDVVGVQSRAFYRCDTIASVCYLGSGSIGNRAFASCSALHMVQIEGEAASIDQYAFFGCPIQTLVVGGNVSSIGKSAFSGCTTLDDVTITDKVSSIGENAFYRVTFYAPDEETVLPHDADSLAGHRFMRSDCGRLVCELYDGYVFVVGDVQYRLSVGRSTYAVAVGYVPGITEAIVDRTVDVGSMSVYVAEVSKRAFYGCTSLTSASIAVPVGERAFTNCTSLESLDLMASGQASVGPCAFYGCTSLSEVAIGDGYALGDKSFYGCTSLSEVSFGNDLSMGSSVFYKAKFYDGDALLSQTPANLAGRTFVGSGAVLYLDLPEFEYDGAIYKPSSSTTAMVTGRAEGADMLSVRSVAYDGNHAYNVAGIGDRAFYNDSGLTGASLEFQGYVGNRAFANCSGLEELTVSSVTEIGPYAFYGCVGISEVSLGSGLSIIGKSAFSGCVGLEELTVPSSVSSIGENAFYRLSFRTFDGNVLDPTADCLSGRHFTGSGRILVSDPEVGDRTAVDGVVYEFKRGPTGTVAISAVSFEEGIASASIPGLMSICGSDYDVSVGSRAFYECSTLESLQVGCEDIGSRAFAKCSALSSVELSGTAHIGDYAFYACKAVRELVLPEGLETIGDSAFSQCVGLKEVSFPDSLASIGDNAFYRCVFYGVDGITVLEQTVGQLGGKAFEGRYNRLVQSPVGMEFEADDLRYLVIGSGQVRLLGAAEGAVVTYVVVDSVEFAGRTFEVSEIGPSAFENSIISSIEMRNTADTVSEKAFYSIGRLRFVTLDVKEIGSLAFGKCKNIERISFSGSLEEVAHDAFQGSRFLIDGSYIEGPTASQLAGHTFVNNGTDLALVS